MAPGIGRSEAQETWGGGEGGEGGEEGEDMTPHTGSTKRERSDSLCC